MHPSYHEALILFVLCILLAICIVTSRLVIYDDAEKTEGAEGTDSQAVGPGGKP